MIGAAGQGGAAGEQQDASGAVAGTAGTGASSDGGGDATGGTAGLGAGGTTGAAGQSTAGASGGAGSVPGPGPVGGDSTMVVRTAGCGLDSAATGLVPGMLIKQTIVTSGVKAATCADKVCGPWGPWTRQYYVRLPTGYDNSKAYPLLLEGPGCGGLGVNLFNFPNAFLDTVIRVGLQPSADAQAIHATNPNQGCFDDHDGDQSVDFVFYENLYDTLAGQLCFDRNRVFAAGHSSGARLASELGCKYAGDTTRPVRGSLADTGDLPTDPRYAPTCTAKPIAAMWVHSINDSSNPFQETKDAIARAMKVDGCTIGTGYDDAQFDNFPIGGGNADTTCQRIKGCPDLTPLVVCPISYVGQASHDNIVNPGFPTFVTLFSMPPLLTP
jgi:predicted esterase